MSYSRFGFGHPRGQRSPRWESDEESSRSMAHASNTDFEGLGSKRFSGRSDRFNSFGRSRRNFYQSPRSHYQGLRRPREAGWKEGRLRSESPPGSPLPSPGREGGRRPRSPRLSPSDDPSALKSWSPGDAGRSGEPGWKHNGKDGTGGRNKEGEGESKDIDERLAFKELTLKRGAGGGEPKKSPSKKDPADWEDRNDIIKCPHCGFSSCDSMEYKKHLFGVKHTQVMLGVRKQLTGVLTMMQSKVRKEEEKKKGSGAKDAKRKFCKTCKVSIASYTEHTESFLHKKILEFLKPFCKICDKAFETHSYEEHICHLEHIKRKMYPSKEVKRKPKDEAAGDVVVGKGTLEAERKEPSDKLLNRDNYAAIGLEGDTVNKELTQEVIVIEDDLNPDHELVKGGGEAVQPLPQGTSASAPVSEAPQTGVDSAVVNPLTKVSETDEPRLRKTTEMKIGVEYCDLIDAYYCELCKQYVSSESLSLEKARDRHCHTKAHLQRLMRVTKLEHRRSYAAKIKAKRDAEVATTTPSAGDDQG